MIQMLYLGHSAIILEFDGFRVAIDPWLKGNPLCPPNLAADPGRLDLIVLSHGHADHASDACRIAQLTGAKVAATYELGAILIGEGLPANQAIQMNKGGMVAVSSGVSVYLTHAFHSSSYDTASGPVYAGEACGVVLNFSGNHIYHAGDTALFSDMELIGDRFSPQVAFLPIGDRFTMGPEDAAIAASLIRAEITIPIHYKTFDLLTGQYSEFETQCQKHAVFTRELAIGEVVSI